MMNPMPFARSIALLLVMSVCLMSTGCIGALAQLFYVIKGHEVPPEYAGLEGQRIAIVAITDGASHGPNSLADTIEKFVGLKLATNLEAVDLVADRKIENWIDINGLDESELANLGQDVEADIVLAINIDGYSIRDGSTMYKGRSDIAITVVDVESGDVKYSFGPEHMEYPENGRPAIQTNDRKFETFYLAWLTKQIAQRFYKHDRLSEVAEEAAFSG